jgi:NADH dehydrogenase (ubiquinone) 1 alpha subcomplex subunit 9
VNLIGRDYHTHNYQMPEVLVDFPVRLARMCKEEGVDRFIHVSAYAASSKANTESLQLKAFAEARVREEEPRAVIIRPAKVYGWADHYFRLIADTPGIGGLKLISKSSTEEPLLKMPISLADTAQAIVNACKIPKIEGQTFDLLGPEPYEMRELALYLFRLIKNGEDYDEEEMENCIKEVPAPILRYYGQILCKMSWKFAPKWTADRVEMLYTSETPRGLPGLAELGIEEPMTIENNALDVVRTYRDWGQFHQPVDETPTPKIYRHQQIGILSPL